MSRDHLAKHRKSITVKNYDRKHQFKCPNLILNFILRVQSFQT